MIVRIKLYDINMDIVFCFTGTIPRKRPKTVVNANGYYEPGEFISRTLIGHNSFEETHVCGFTQTFVNDGIDGTCVDTTADDKQLQVMFYFSFVSPGHQMSVEVVMKNV